MFRSMMLVCAIGALGAVGCVTGSDAANESAVAQNTGGGGVHFNCQNVKDSITIVHCVGSVLDVITNVSIDKITVDVKNVSVLDNSQIDVLDNDLNNLNISDIDVLNVSDVLNKVEVTALSDFQNKFGDINVTKNDIDVCAVTGLCI